MSLIFNYGVMGSAKTAELLIKKHNYEEKGLKTLVLQPKVNNRDGEGIVKSRIGIETNAVVLNANQNISKIKNIENVNIILVDEAQFLKEHQVEELKKLSENALIICYGLKTDFSSKLFEGSKRLVEISDSMREIEAVCECGRKAEINARIVNDKVQTTGEQVQLGANELYKPMCYHCWNNKK